MADKTINDVYNMLRENQKMAQRQSGPVDLSLDSLKNGIKNSAEGLNSFAESAKGSLNVWRELSRNGSNFSNDLIGMSAAAAESRMSLGDFADVVKENGKNFAGLGGSVTRGSEAFAKLSKGFFESGLDQRFREMGYTTKDMNEMMSLVIAQQRSSTRLDQRGREQMYEATMQLSTEFDLTAKLMGKSREQQMEEAKARTRDAQVEARIRLETRGMDAKDAAEYRNQVYKALKTATDQGFGEAGKEIYAMGQVYTEAGATQTALFSEATQNLTRTIGAVRQKDFEGAARYDELTKASAAKAANDPRLLQVIASSQAVGGSIQTVSEQFTKAGQTQYDAIQKVAAANNLNLNSTEDYRKALKLAQKEIEASATGKGEGGVDVSGLTRGVLAVEKGAQELRAGLAGAAKAVDTEGRGIATSLRKVGNALDYSLREITGPTGSLGGKIRSAAELGMRGEKIERRPGESELEFKQRKKDEEGGFVGSLANTLKNISTVASNTIETGILTVSKEVNFLKGIQQTPEKEPTKKYSKGTLGIDNQLFTNFGQGTLAELHGREAVVTPEQLEQMAKGLKATGIETALTGLVKSVSPDKSGNIDINKAMSGINATISSVQKSAPNVENLLGDFMAGPMFGKKSSTSTTETITGGGSTLRQVVDTPAKIKLEKEQDALLEQYRLNRKAIADKIKQETGLKGKSLFEAMEASPEALALKAKFEKENDDYSKKILNERQAVTEILEADSKTAKEKVNIAKKDLENNLTSSKKQTAAQEEKTKASLEELRLAVQDATAKKQKSADDRDYHGQVEYLANVKLNEAKKDFEKDKSEKNRQRVEEAQRTVDGTRKTAALMRAKDDENQQKLDNARKSFLDAKKKSTEIDKQTSTPKTSDTIKENAPKATLLGADGKVNLDAFSMGSNGMPIIRDIKAKAAEIPESVKPKEDEAKKQAEETAKKATAQATTTKPKEETTSATKATGKAATLDDVVSSLNSLNSKMSQLLSQSQELGSRQISATKSNSQNLYAR